MKPFDLEEYNRLVAEGKTPKIVTRKGDSARIICTDKDGDYAVVALVKSGDKEIVTTCTSKGRYYDFKTDYDLYFADPEPTYRPYKDEDECFEDVIKHGGWIRNHSGQYLFVYAVADGTMTFGDYRQFPFERACKMWVWADDRTPCGVKEG